MAVLGAGAHAYLDWSLLRVFPAKYVHVSHHTRCVFGHTLLLEVVGRSALCCSSSDVIFATSSELSLGAVLLGKHRSWSSWHDCRAKL